MTILSAAVLPMLVFLAKATLILVAALGITIALQRASAGTRHLVWLVTLAALLLVPALTAWSPIQLRILPPASESISRIASPVDRLAVPVLNAPSAGRSESQQLPAPQASIASPGSVFSNLSIASILFAIWAIVVLAIASSLGFAALVVRRIVRRATVLDSPDWLNPLWEVADRLGLDEPPRLLRSEDAKMPFACGVLKPTIVVPADCDNWNLDRRRAVLLHELAHVRRHDLVGHTLGRLACALYWFHPLVWTAAKNLRSESERACDDLALSCGAKATDYAEHLLEIVTSVRRDATPSVALAMARRKEFEGRMLAILDPDLRHSSPGRKETIMLTAALALTTIIVGAAAPVARTENVTPDAKASAAATPTAATVALETIAAAKSKAAAPSSADAPGTSNPATGSDAAAASSSSADANVNARVTTFSPAVAVGVATSVAQRTVTMVSTDVINSLLAGDKGAKGFKGFKGSKDADDRPILLAKILRTDASADLRRIAAWGLSEYADNSDASSALANAVRKDTDERVREMAAWALSNADDQDNVAGEALAGALRSDASLRVRTTAAWALGESGSREGVNALVSVLGDPNREIRMRAVWAIGNIGPREAPRALFALLRDPDAKIRQVTAWALYNIEDAAAVPALDAALRAESSKELQLDYIRALAALGDKSVDAIKGLLESSDPRVKTMAVQALAGGQAAGPWPWPWPEPRPQP